MHFNPSIFHGRRVFLTGITGFKGSWLAEWLLSMGAEISGYALEPDTSPALFDQLRLRERTAFRAGDIRDADALRAALCEARPDFVFHLAAQPLVRLSYQEPVATYETNVLGTIHLLEALRAYGTLIEKESTPARRAVAILITTDKVYENREWPHGYREEDALGGYDPYSSSKAACEIAIASWQRSFFQKHPVQIGVARAGNVIGGGDWAADRIVPDCIRSLIREQPVPVRNKVSTRPWQHVLEPLSGYLTLAARLFENPDSIPRPPLQPSAAAFNFGPNLEANRTVAELVAEVLRHWPGSWEDRSDPNAPHEAGKLNLATDKAFHLLGWKPRWNFSETIAQTVRWYRSVHEGADPGALTRAQIAEYAAE